MREPKQRTFVIPTERSVYDPAWMVACFEQGVSSTGININGQHIPNGLAYSNYNEIKDLITKLESKQSFDAGYSKCYDDICEKFGFVSPRELDEAASVYKSKSKGVLSSSA